MFKSYRCMKVLILFCLLFCFFAFSPRGGRLEIAEYPYKFINGASLTFYMEGGYASPRIVAKLLDQLKGGDFFKDREIGYVVLAVKNENIPKVHSFLEEVKSLMKKKGVVFFIYGTLDNATLDNQLPIDVVRW